MARYTARCGRNPNPCQRRLSKRHLKVNQSEIGGRRLINLEGREIGTALERRETDKGAVVLVSRVESLGGGTVVFPIRELEDRGKEIAAPYDELSLLEAPPYSPNVNLGAYVTYWQRLADTNYSSSATAFLPTGSGRITGEIADAPDDQIEAQVKRRLRAAASHGVRHRTIQVTVNNGTVILQGHQNDTPTRLAAAQAASSVPGVKEIVNMIVVRAEI